MILPVYICGQQILRKVCKDLPADYKNLEQLIENMFETMCNADGVGLAGPQIGLDYRIFVVDLNIFADERPEFKGFKKAFINARITERDGEDVVAEEGCLSIPGIHENVTRKNRIRIQYLDENLQPQDEYFEDYKARVIQHEYDHIEGVLFVDHISGIRRQLIKNKLNNMLRGKVNCSYKVKPVGLK
ncbi:MAG: peptide deformylase [Dysgonamonadaceae bacterium]|jgi:peptide deformylase|nr:peptide deformylase [Dysgonamonadaceae bacterium]